MSEEDPPRPNATLNYLELPGAPAFDATKEFYTTVFGWTWLDFGPTYAEFGNAGITGGLNGLAHPGPGPEPGSENGLGPLLLFETDDLEVTKTSVQAAGAQITSGPYPYPGGDRFHFKDPSGNILAVYRSAPGGA